MVNEEFRKFSGAVEEPNEDQVMMVIPANKVRCGLWRVRGKDASSARCWTGRF